MCLLIAKLQNTFFLFMDLEEEKYVSSDEEEGGEVQLELLEQTLGTLDLREFEICPSRHRRRRRRKKKEQTAKPSDGRPRILSLTKGGFSYTKQSHLIIRFVCFLRLNISYLCVTELSDIEADSEKEEVPEATVVEDARQKIKSKKKRKVQTKKQLEGEDLHLTIVYQIALIPFGNLVCMMSMSFISL